MYEEAYDKAMEAGAVLPFTLPGWIAVAPFEEYLEMRIDEVETGRAVLSMPFKVKHAQGMGLMHGGAVTSLADTAVAIAIKGLLPEGTHFATISLNLRFHAPVRSGRVKAVATVTGRDDGTIHGEADLYNEVGVKTASFTSIFKIKRR